MSFPFLAATVYANIDWMVMLGVVIGGRLGVILDTVKPQAGAFAIVAEVAKKETWRERLKLVLPLAVLAVLSVPFLLPWLNRMFAVGESAQIRSFSLFPYTIPLGIALLWLTWKRKEPLLGVFASLCLSPYFYIHSLMPALFLLGDRNWKWGVVMNILLWGVFALILVGVIPIDL